jgi:hypothetical protein
MKTLFMETTKIEPEQTVTEIQKILGQYGAGGVMTEYDPVTKEVKTVFFKINVKGKDIAYRLPSKWEPIRKILESRLKRTPSNAAGEAIKNQAKRVAWRQTLRWVEAQLAYCQTDQVKIQEAFLVYMQVNIEGQTLYEKLEAKGFTAITDQRQ